MPKSTRIIDPVLTEIAVGYTNENFVAEELFPVVLVTKEGVKIPKYAKDAFGLYETGRAPGADSNQLKLTPKSTVDAVLEEKDIAIPIDVRESADSDFEEESDAAEIASEILKLGLEKESADMACDPDKYSDTNKLGLTTSWDEELSNPIKDVEDGKEAIRTKIGRYPNKALLSPKAYNALKNHPDLVDRIKHSQKGILTPELLAEIFDLKKVVVGKAVYSENGDQKDVWDNVCILAYVPEKVKSYRVPSCGFTLRRKGYMQADRYPSAGGKVNNVRATDLRVPKIVEAGAMYLITNCASTEDEGE